MTSGVHSRQIHEAGLWVHRHPAAPGITVNSWTEVILVLLVASTAMTGGRWLVGHNDSSYVLGDVLRADYTLAIGEQDGRFEVLSASAEPARSRSFAPSGPLIIEGPVVILDNAGDPIEPPPSKIPGQVKLCGCGLSKTRPFCDGSHKLVGFCTEEPTD